MKYNINYLETCLPDYFNGHRLPVVQVVVDSTTTYGRLKESLLDWQCIDHIEDLDEDAYKEAVNVLFENIDLNIVPDNFSFIEEHEDEDESYDSVYSFFSIKTIEGDDE